MNKVKVESPKSKSIDIEHVAKLANINLTQEEKELFEKQLGEVLGYFESLEKVDTKSIETIGHITGLENVTREDIAAPSLSQDEAISQAPKVHNGFVEVEAIIEND